MIQKSRKVTLHKTEDWRTKEPRVEARYHTPYTGPLGSKIVATVYHPTKTLIKFGPEVARRVLEEGKTVEAYDTEQFIIEAYLNGTWEDVGTLKELRKLRRRGVSLRVDGENVTSSAAAEGKLAYLLG